MREFLALRNGFRLPPQEVERLVLQLDVAPELVFTAFEDATLNEYDLNTSFVCVTVCPVVPERFESAALGEVVPYPSAFSPAVRFDEPPAAGALGAAVHGKLCVFAAERAWQPAEAGGVSRFVKAFGPFPLAVLEHSSELDEPLNFLFAGQPEQPILAFFRRVSARRTSRKERVTVLWDDQDYSPIGAFPV